MVRLETMWILLLLLADKPDISRYLLWRNEVAEPHAVIPTFPKGLKTGPEGARVVLEVEVDAQGLPRRARILDGAEPTTQMSALRAILGWRFAAPSNAAALRTVRVVFVYRTMPAGTAVEQLAPIYRGKYEIEIRALEERPPNDQMQRAREDPEAGASDLPRR